MKKTNAAMTPTQVALAVALTVMHVGAALAQEAAKPAANTGSSLNLDEVVITAAPEARPKIRQSLSISTMNADQIQDSGATSAAEILRSIPGVRAEASSGEGNANVTVRGVPISAGGSRYVQFQEDGLPVLLFGDFNFITPDMFIRADYGTDGLEVVRGGSASTLATNAAGGVINFLSKTGETAGGSVGVTTNLGGGTSRRVDFTHGAKVSDSSNFQISGFLRSGEGLRKTDGVDLEKGGQLRAVLTKDFGGGNTAKLFVKVLDDQTPTNLPSPVRIVNGKIQELQGVDPRTFSPYSNNLPRLNDPAKPGFGLFNGPAANVNNGLRSKSTAFGGEVNLNMGGGWVVNDKFRLSSNTGEFNGFLPDGYYGANGKNPDTNNPAAYKALYLGARFNDAGLAVNDLKATKAFQVGEDQKLTTTAGLFVARQRLDLDWEIGSIPSTLPVNGNTTFGAYTSYYKRNLNLTYDTLAPYGALGFETGPWNFDASARFDRQDVTGTFQDNGGDTAAIGAQRVKYDTKLNSFSAGVNYKLNKDLGLFARASRGGALQSDRILFPNGAAIAKCGNHCFQNVTVDPNRVTQYEGGVKYRQGNFSSFVTLFKANTDESNYDLTTGQSSSNKYEAMGVEVESSYRIGAFRVNGGVTYTNADVTASNNAAYVGKAPNRQARLIYQVAPTYTIGQFTLGGSLIGTTKSRDVQTDALLETELPAYAYVNAFARYEINAATTVMLGVNNLFDKVGYTEANGDRAAARSINGRTVNLGLRYNY